MLTPRGYGLKRFSVLFFKHVVRHVKEQFAPQKCPAAAQYILNTNIMVIIFVQIAL
jgi:hypothetical protein